MSQILLLIKNRQNRQVLEEWLAKEHELVRDGTEDPLNREFDLALVDGPTLKKLRPSVRKRRESAEPVFLPFLLLTVRRKGSIPLHDLGRYVDDVLTKPLHPDELRARIANLLRRRELSLVLKKEHDQVVRLSVTDDVSGFHNTRYLRRYMDRFFDSAKARDRKLSLVFFDVDDFKTVVDTHGHQLGSKALREVAQAINRVLGEQDEIVRYGGDEFVVILPDQDKERARLKVERMRESISSTLFLQKETLGVPMTASFGCATYPDDAAGEEELLAAADECLFKSKRTGKNRITLTK